MNKLKGKGSDMDYLIKIPITQIHYLPDIIKMVVKF